MYIYTSFSFSCVYFALFPSQSFSQSQFAAVDTDRLTTCANDSVLLTGCLTDFSTD